MGSRGAQIEKLWKIDHNNYKDKTRLLIDVTTSADRGCHAKGGRKESTIR